MRRRTGSLSRSGPAKLGSYAELESETNALLASVLRPQKSAAAAKKAKSKGKASAATKKKSGGRRSKKKRRSKKGDSAAEKREMSSRERGDDRPRASRDDGDDDALSARRRQRGLPARSHFASSVEVLDYDDEDERPRSARSEDAGDLKREREHAAVFTEAEQRDFKFGGEVTRVASGVDSFVPETGMSQRVLDGERERVGAAVLTVETKAIEAEELERTRKRLGDKMESDAARTRYTRQLGGHAAATSIQAQLRGRLERDAASGAAKEASPLPAPPLAGSESAGFVFDDDEELDSLVNGAGEARNPDSPFDGTVALPLAPLFGTERGAGRDSGGGLSLPAVTAPSPRHIQTQWVADDPRFVKQARAALRSGAPKAQTLDPDSFASASQRIFLPDGHASQSALRATVRQALGRNRFDSVATLLAEPPPAEAAAAKRRAADAASKGDGSEWMRASSTLGRAGDDGRPMAAASLRRSRKTRSESLASPRSPKAKTTAAAGLAIRDVSHPSFQSTEQVGGDSPAAGGGKGGNATPLLGSAQMWEGKEICFACWSAGAGMTCRLHVEADPEAALLTGEKSVLVCDNWELDVMRKRYRSEELQEVFAKMNSSLRWNNGLKRFQTVMESKHPTYRAVTALTDELNRKFNVRMRLNKWVQSFIEDVRMSRSPKLQNNSGPKLLRLKKTIANHSICIRMGKLLIEFRPLAPTTRSVDPIHRPEAETPIPLVLFRARPYRPLPVQTMPLDSAAFLPVPPSKTMDERCTITQKSGGVRWLEQLSKQVASAAMERATSGGAQVSRKVGAEQEKAAAWARLHAGDKQSHPFVVRADPVVQALAELAAQGAWFDDDGSESSDDEDDATKKAAAVPRPERLGIERPILLETDNNANFFSHRGVGPRNMACGGLPRAMTLMQTVISAHPAQYGGLCAIQTDMVAPLRVMPSRIKTERNPAAWLLPSDPAWGADNDGWRHRYPRYKSSFNVMELQRLIPHMSCAIVGSALREAMWNCPSVVVSASLLGSAATKLSEAIAQREEASGALRVAWAAQSERKVQQRGGFLEGGVLGLLQDDTGYRLVVPCEGLVIDPSIPSSTFIPSEEIAVPNKPNFLPGVNTHADPDHYPFCVPTTLKNSLLDFYHLLGNDSGETSNDPCCFSSIGQQRSGNFGIGGDFGGAVGVLECSVYRSYAYAQTGEIEKMETDDGVEYWLNRRTGETYWEAPLSYEAKEEEKSADAEKRRKRLRKQAKALALAGGGAGAGGAGGAAGAAAPGATILLVDKQAMRHDEVTRHITTKHADALELSKQRERDDVKSAALETLGGTANQQAMSQAASMASATPKSELAEREAQITTPRLAMSGMRDARVHGVGSGTPRSSQLSARGQMRLQPQVYRSDGSVRPGSRGGGSTRPGSASSFRSMASAAPKLGNKPIHRGSTSVPMLSLPHSGTDVGDEYDIMDTERSDLTGVHSPSQSRNGGGGGSSASDQRQLLASLKQALGSALPMIREQDGGSSGVSSSQLQSMLELGMGLGLGIGMRQGGNTGGDQSASAAPRGDAASSHHSQSHLSHAHSQQQRVRVAGSDAGMTSISRVDINATPRSEHLDQLARSEHGLMRPSSADSRRSEESMVPTAMPDDAEHYHAEQAALALAEGDADKMISMNKPVPERGFAELVAAVYEARTGAQQVDYLPQALNINAPGSLGVVKPESMLREWLEQGVNPWAEGRDEPQSTMAGGLDEASEEDEDADRGGIKLTGDSYHDGGGGGGGGGDRVKQQLADMKHQAEVENAEGQQLIELFSLCRHGKYAEIEDLFDDPSFLLPIDAKDDLGNTLLMLACQNGNKRIVKLCLRRGANINTQNLNGQTGLHFCHAYNEEKLSKYLVSKGADDGITNFEGMTCYEGLSRSAVEGL